MPSASFLFLLFLYFRNLLLEIFSELDQKLRGLFLRQDKDGVRRAASEVTHRAQAATIRGLRGPIGGTRPCPWATSSAPSDAYKIRNNQKISGQPLFFHRRHPNAMSSQTLIRGVIPKQFPAPYRRGDQSRRALHRHAFLRDDL